LHHVDARGFTDTSHALVYHVSDAHTQLYLTLVKPLPEYLCYTVLTGFFIYIHILNEKKK